MARKRRRYTDEFKAEAVRLVEEEVLSIAQVSRDLDIPSSVLGAWVHKASRAQPGEPTGPGEPLEAEVRRLRREVAILKEEREILKKATAFFAKESR